jgi:MSHA pilin protein MshA
MRQQQSGFTLIELVIVIVILGLLAATALPRFADLTEDAAVASFNGVRGGFRSAIAITHAQWLADGSSNNPVLEGVTIPVNASGWPTITPSESGLFSNLLAESISSMEGWSTSGTGNYTLQAGGITCTFQYTPATGGVAVVGTCP